MLEIAPLLMALQMLLAPDVAPPAAAPISVTVPIPAQSLATALGLANPDSSTLMLRIIRHVYGAPDAQARRLHETLINALASESSATASVRVPLNPQVWQDAILQGRAESSTLMSAILKDRAASFVYFGLAALD